MSEVLKNEPAIIGAISQIISDTRSIVPNILPTFEDERHVHFHVRKKRELKDEVIIKQIRAHWIIHVPAFMIFVSVLFGTGLLIKYHEQFSSMFNLAPQSWLILVAVNLILAIGIISNTIILWLYNYYILTNCRVLHFRIQKGFHYEAEEIWLDRVKYVDAKRPSLFALVFNFGHLELGIDLNSRTSIFRLRWIKAPHRIMKKLNEVI